MSVLRFRLVLISLGFCSFVSLTQALQHFVPVGCFRDDLQNRALPDLIINHRVTHPVIDWSNLSITIRSCARTAQDKGYVYFALQFWGECWAGHFAHVTYDKYGTSSQCEKGVGKGYTNFVYRNTGVESECEAPMVLDEPDRAMTYTKTLSSYLCDDKMAEGWYRFKGKAGNDIANTCGTKTMSRCGTLSPGWLQGPNPQPSQGITDGKVCFEYKGNCCRVSEPIKVRNCGRFNVYKLKPPAIGCYLRYCGNGI